MPEKKRKPTKSGAESTNPHEPERRDIEAEIPHSPALEPIAEPPPLGGTRGPRPQIEPEVE